jgi:CheY-like chemotaxis protein
MGRKVFVKVVGFEDGERHALNLLFRLSESRETTYAPWTPGQGADASLALIDSESYEALLEFASPSNAKLPMVWVGPGAPARAWRSFERPLQWPEVIATMDTLFQPAPALDVDLGAAAPAAAAPGKRALIASADLGHRLYLRARLALAGITQADDAQDGAQVLQLVRGTPYDVALLDFGLPGISGWDLLGRVREAHPRIPHVIVTKERVSFAERVRARWRGRETLMRKPPHPGQLSRLLGRV